MAIKTLNPIFIHKGRQKVTNKRFFSQLFVVKLHPKNKFIRVHYTPWGIILDIEIKNDVFSEIV